MEKTSPTLFSDKTNDHIVRREEVVVAHHCAVATDDKRCSKIALDVLRGVPPYPHRGNAIDAAVAAALALGVVSPASSGLGGGAFMLLRLANGTTQAFDMREVAPLAASKNMYHGNPTLKAKGPLSIAVPGELAGLYEAWKKYGSLPWDSLVKPAEDLARGFKISAYLYWEMSLMKKAIFADDGLSEIFTSNGNLLQEGDICRNKKLAETLKEISHGGMNAFYNGKIVEYLIKDIQDCGGIIKKEDLQNYKVKQRKPIVADISGLKFIGMPPPSAGGAGIVLMLNILAQYRVPWDVHGNTGIHRVVEALKHLFAVRLNIGDPDFVDVSKIISDMLSVDFAIALKKSIDDHKTYKPEHYGAWWNELHEYQMHEHGTSHFSIVDNQGNAVAMTSSVNYHFGAQILSPRTGILLNNQMNDFSMPDDVLRTANANRAPANFISPGKRPLSSMSPTIILKNEKLKAVVGASGGTLIIPGVAEVILNHFAKRMDQLASVMAPRVYHQLSRNVLHYEKFTTVTDDHIEIPVETQKDLKKKGHDLRGFHSGAACQFITIKELLMENGNYKESIVAVSDPRKGGVPAGY